MASTLRSLKDFLQQRRLTRKNNGLPLAQRRQRLEKSQLLRTMQDICAAINTEAGTVIVDEHHYLPPEPVVSSFAFSKGQMEYVICLQLWAPRPSLAFSRWVYLLAEAEPLSVNFKFSCELQEEDVSDEEIKQCFYCLLSGLSRSYSPAFRPSKDFAKGRGRE
jgi:hypothetical protein